MWTGAKAAYSIWTCWHSVFVGVCDIQATGFQLWPHWYRKGTLIASSEASADNLLLHLLFQSPRALGSSINSFSLHSCWKFWLFVFQTSLSGHFLHPFLSFMSTSAFTCSESSSIAGILDLSHSAWELLVLLQRNEWVANFPMHYSGPMKLSVASLSHGAGKLVVFWQPWDLSSHLTTSRTLPTSFLHCKNLYLQFFSVLFQHHGS